MKHGLSQTTLNHMINSFKKFKEIEKVKIYGSRALGNYKKGSDVDLALFGATVKEETLLALSSLLNEGLPLPYFFDIVIYDKINNSALTEHIDKIGIQIF